MTKEKMLFTADIGNTTITIVVYREDEPLFLARINSDRRKTSDQYAYDLKQLLEAKKCGTEGFTGAVLSSVVPELSPVLKATIKDLLGTEALMVDLGVKTKLDIKCVNRGELGADLVAGAVSAKVKYPLPCLIWDLGTATKISVLDENGAYLGCTISAGIKMCIEHLGSGTSLLNPIEIKAYNKPFGNVTFDSIASGTIVGTAVMLEGLSERIMQSLGYESMCIVITGGLAPIIANSVEKYQPIYDKSLINDGLKLIYEYNQGGIKNE
ncbi:MAG: type III pantothenate kinase [Ruminococcaceae bacterium]|nr:type III pantothenate kinase [Oscillospiraceae bacterium]